MPQAGDSASPYYERVRVSVIIPTFNGLVRLERALDSLRLQTTLPDEIIVVDNASSDNTVAALAEDYPEVTVIANTENLGFGRAVNRGFDVATGDVLVLLNNDVVCEAAFLEQLLGPLETATVGMVAGVLLQEADPTRIDTAGLVLDRTMRSWDYLSDRPISELRAGVTPPPLGPCGGAAAYRTEAIRSVGGFDEALFAYWEDVDLTIRLQNAGWRCALATDARAIHAHGATLGATSPRMRELDAFGRGFVLGKYGVARRGVGNALATAALDWPVFLVHLAARREATPLRARHRGIVAGKARRTSTKPWSAEVSVASGLKSQWGATFNRLRGRGPAHFRAKPDEPRS